MVFKTRHRPVPITPYRSTSLLGRGDDATLTHRDVTMTHIAGKAYTLPRRHRHHQQQQPSSSQRGFSAVATVTPPPPRLLTTAAGDGGGLTLWVGDDDDFGMDDRLTPRCTCTLRRVVSTSRSSQDAAVVPAGCGVTDNTPSSSSMFSTFKPAATASPLPRSAVSDCGTFYDRPMITAAQREDPAAPGGGSDYGPQRRDRPVK